MYTRKIRDDLEFGRIKYHKKFVTVCSGPKITPSMMKEKQLSQMSTFRRITELPAKETGKVKIILSGKLYGGQDDTYMAFILSLLAGDLFRDNKDMYMKGRI